MEGVEAFLPLSPKCALYMPCIATSADILERYGAATELHRVVRSHVLRGLAGGSEELQTAQLVINRLHPLVQAFTKGTPITANGGNIQNLNYLQCSWSHAAIYIQSPRLCICAPRLSRKPQYRAVPKTSLVQMNLLAPEPRAKT